MPRGAIVHEVREEMEQIKADATGIKAMLERMERDRGVRNTTTVRIEGGGVGVWVAVTCCLVMLAAMMVGSLWMTREFARIDKELNERKEEGQRMQSYLSAIYVNAPHLKPTEESNDAADR